MEDDVPPGRADALRRDEEGAQVGVKEDELDWLGDEDDWVGWRRGGGGWGGSGETAGGAAGGF